MYNWITLLYTWNEHIIVNQLYFNKNLKKDMTSSMLQPKYHSYIDQKWKWLGMEKSPLTSLFDLHAWKLSSREDTARARPQLETE